MVRSLNLGRKMQVGLKDRKDTKTAVMGCGFRGMRVRCTSRPSDVSITVLHVLFTEAQCE